jgi:hypothetical protein
MMTKVAVRIDSSRPIFIEADAESFAEIFLHADSEAQAEILRLCFEKLRYDCPLQIDYIGMELEKPGYKETRRTMGYLARFPEIVS